MRAATNLCRTEPDLDPDVLHRLSNGDPEALGAVYDRFSKPVWTVAMSVLHDRQLAEDAMSETFMRLWKSVDSYDSSRPLAPFLFTIARRTALDVHRRESRPTRRGEGLGTDDVVVHLPKLDETWEAWEIRLAVERLNEEERDVVRLSHYLQMTHSEIAEQLDVPVGTVKSRSHRAHRRLATSLRHLLTDGGTT